MPLVLRRSSRARRLSLRISALDGRVTLTLPQRLPEAEALKFASEKEDWIRSHLSRHPQAVEIQEGGLLPVEGRLRRIAIHSGRGVRLKEGVIEAPGRSPVRSIERYLKELARDRLAEASDRYAARLGVGYTRLTLRDTRSRWGSCSSAGALMYSWRLILAPREILEYVAAHEVAHLREMNHSADFWALVHDLYGESAAARLWLREQGAELHRYRF